MIDVIQGSPEWHALRLGKVTASRVHDIIARTKSGFGASRANYMAQLIAERLTGVAADAYTNAAMQWGTATEPEARMAYEFHTDFEVMQVGFVAHPRIIDSGCSPDGLVGERGLVEFKCPNTATHIDTLLGAPIPAKYVTQCMWQMACTRRDWCDLCSYDPRLPESMRLYIYHIVRDDEMIDTLEKEVSDFLTETSRKVVELRSLYEPTETAA
jgi:putative phage-type endonuclease